MSDFGLFESDEAAGLEPRVAARTAARRLEAAIDEVRAKFGPFLLGATGIDEFGDRWHYSKADIRKTVEPYVHPATGTMRRVMNAMKADWKLAHPYKVGGGNLELDNLERGERAWDENQSENGDMYYGPGRSGPKFSEEYLRRHPERFPHGHGLEASRRQALSHDEAGFGSMPEGDHDHRNQNLKKTYHPSDGNLIPSGDFESWKDSVDQGGPEKVEAHDFTPGGDSGAAKKARRVEADSPYGGVRSERFMPGFGHKEPPWEYSDKPHHQHTHPYDRELEYGKHGPLHDDYQPLREPGDYEGKHRASLDREAAALVADIYTDFAQANGLRVASLDTLDFYAQTGIHEDDYRLLQSMIVRTAEADCPEGCEESDDDEDSDDDDSDTDSAPPSPSESDDSDDSDTEDDEEADDAPEPSESDSDDESDDSDSEGGETPDFGGDDTGGDVSQTFTVPEHAPELDPQMMGEIPADDTDGSAPVPPEVVDSLLGLPPGTIEQLLLEEVEQGAQGGAPEAGGGDFFGEGGGDSQRPPRVARRTASFYEGPGGGLIVRSQSGWHAIPGHLVQDFHDGANINDVSMGLHRTKNDAAASLAEAGKPQSSKADFVPPSLEEEYGPRWNAPVSPPRANERPGAAEWREDYLNRKYSRQFWAAPDETEDELTERQKRDQKDSIDTKYESWTKSKTASQKECDICKHEHGHPGVPAVVDGKTKHGLWAFMCPDHFKSHGIGLGTGRGQHIGARSFWAADDDQSGGGDSGGGQQAPAAMGGGMMPPPGSQSIQPPAPAAPLENQPAEDQLLDMASQAITQMIDRETSEFQQIIDPLTQALQAVQFAQQVESAEHPLDVTPPQGTVNVDPSQAPAGQAMQQQASRRSAGSRYFNDEGEPLMSGSQARFEDYLDADRDPYEDHYGDDYGPDYDDGDDDDEGTVHGQHPNDYHDDKEWMDFRASRTSRRRQAKISQIIKDAAYVIARRYNISEHGYRQMVAAALGRRDYEHLLEAVRLAHPAEREDVGGHLAHLLAAGNPRFNKDVWMKAVMASKPRDRAWDAWASGRDRGDAEHARHDLDDREYNSYSGEGDVEGRGGPVGYSAGPDTPGGRRIEHSPAYHSHPDPGWRPTYDDVAGDPRFSSRGRRPFDRPRLAGETWKNMPIPDTFEFENDQPQSRDNMTINDLPKVPGGHVGSSQRAIDRFQRWENYRQQRGLPAMSDDAEIHNFQQTSKPYKSKVGDEAEAKIHRDRNLEPDSPKAPKVKVPRAVNPVLKGKGTKTPAAPKPTVPKTKAAAKQASFFTRKVPGWRWDDHLSGYISKEGRAFTCACGEKVAAPSYKTCSCGKVWNVYAIGDTHHLASDSAEMFIAREIPVRDNVIMANRKMAAPDRWFEQEQEDLHRQRRHEEDDADAWAEKRMNTPYLDDGAYREANRKMAGDRFGEDVSPVYVVRTQNGERQYVADDAAHAWEQHADAFGGQDGEEPLDVPHLHGMSDPDLGIGLDQREANRKMANMYELDQSKVHPDWHYNGWDWEHAPTDSRVMLGEDDLGNDYYSFHQGGQHYEGQHDPHAFLSKSPEELLNNFGIEHPGLPEHPSRIKDANVSQRELLAMIDKLADWTKYDDPEDPVAKAYGKSKIPSTKAPKIPRDWSKREPDGKWKNTNFAPKKK